MLLALVVEGSASRCMERSSRVPRRAWSVRAAGAAGACGHDYGP